MEDRELILAAKEKALEAASAAGRVLLDYFRKEFQIRKKGRADLVTEADLAAERIILDTLRPVFPGHGFLLEEKTAEYEELEYTWVVDPLDGTTNFAHGYPCFAVSIALRHRREEILGVVLAPVSGELFLAIRGGGAWQNGEPLRVSETARLEDALLVTGFPYDFRERPADYVSLFEKFLWHSQGVRRDGSAALDLCYVAAGRFDGFWERRLHPWDTAAGALLVREAGGRISRFDGSPFDIFDREIVASNGRLHEAMTGVTGASPSTGSTKD